MATFEPFASTHGYTDAPPLTITRGADHVAPQSLDWEYLITLVLPSTSSHTAASLLPPAWVTTGKAGVVSPEVAGPTSTFVNVRPPLVERPNFTPPLEVAYTKPTLSLVPASPPPPSAIRVPGGQMQPVWSTGVAPTVEIG